MPGLQKKVMNMPGTHHNLFALTVSLIVGYASLTTSVIAQDATDLKQENEQLKNQVRKLTEELKSAQNRIVTLERQIEQLKLTLDQASDKGSAASSPPTPTTQGMDPAKPEDNPQALFRAMKKDYAEATRDFEIGVQGDRNRAAYLRVVERWIAFTNRNYKSKIEWHVTIFDGPQPTRESSLKLQAVDPSTGETIDQPFSIALNRQLTRRFRQFRKKDELDTFILIGVLTPKLKLTTQSDTSDPFHNPRLVGPFAEFGYSIDVKTIVPIEKEDDAR